MAIGVFEQGVAAAGLVVCVALLVRLLVGPVRRRAMDKAVARLGAALKHQWIRLRYGRQARADASRIAEAAIRRARDVSREATRDGNVVRPKAFAPTPPPPRH